MGFTIPDKGEGQNDIQSILFQEDLEIMVAGLSGVDCVLSGCGCTAQGSPDMTVAVAKGAVLSNGVMFPVTAGNATITTADATNPRIDAVVVNSSGAKAVRAGTAAAAPRPPNRTANDVVLAYVFVPANDTTISTAQIIDKRISPPFPTLIYKATAAVTTNTAATVELLNKANNGVTIPSGMFTAGHILRVRMGGNMLLNNGTGVNQLSIIFGGTTMYNFSFAAQVADADRGAWHLDFDVIAQGNSDQSMVGSMEYTDFQIARTLPGTGIGTLSVNTATAEAPTAMSGASAVDADAADRLLSVLWTMASNSANETVVEYATVELL